MNRNVSLANSVLIEDLYTSDRPWKTLYLLYAQNKKTLFLAILFHYTKLSPTWVIPIVTANLITIISDPSHHKIHELWVNALVGTLFVLQNPLTSVIYLWNLSLTARNAEAALRSAICRRLQQLNLAFYKNKSNGALQSKALRDVDSVDQLFRGLFESGLGAIGAFTSAIVVTALRAPDFLPFFLLVIPPVCLMRVLLTARLRKSNSEFRQEFEGMSSRIVTMIDMIPVARAHAVEESEIEKIDNQLHLVKQAGLKVDRNNALFSSLGWVLFTLLNLGALVGAGWLCYTKRVPLTPGDVVLLAGYFSSISGAVLTITNLFPNVTRGFEAIRSIGDVLESPDLELNRHKPDLAEVKGAFRFEDVVFAYPDTETPAIQHFSLVVKAGSTVALVGPSGSGKSTMMGLILGFQRPTLGRILLDGRDMNEFDLRSFRERVAVVSQETLLFQGTVRENILYGTPDVSDERLQQAIKDANALEFVERLPEGLETMLGEKGARLSGGQKQRIAIARAIIRNPRVLILDEATSALDVEAERLVQEALERLMQGRTTFVVAHRLSTIRNAGTIVVLESGRISEMGTLGELLMLNGSFAAMYHLQLGGLSPLV